MLQAAFLLLALTGQQPTQQPAAAPAKPAATQQADTSKPKPKVKRARAHKGKAAAAPRDTTKSKP